MTPPLSDDALFARLVGFDSVSRNSNLPLADFICEYVDRTGVRVARDLSPEGDKVNLVIAAGPERRDRTGLALSGHMDVVPADESEWESDPFTLTDRDDRWIGRGAADMKGFLALALNRFVACDPARLRHPLTLILTRDEELGTLGAEHFATAWRERDVLPRDVVIGEPTSLAVVRMHKGYLKARLEFSGVAAHSGYPHLGRSAIEPAARAVVALAELRRQLEHERPAHHEDFPDVPYAALTVGTIAGGAAINVVPDRCVVQLGVRLLPEMSGTEMIERIRHAVAAAVRDTDWTLEVLGESPAMLLAEDAALHRDLCRHVGQERSRSVHFATDAGWLQTMGCECVVWGPGAIEVAHKPNEFMPKDQFRRAGDLLDALLHARSGDGWT
jgi:acetylornithine deacetylase